MQIAVLGLGRMGLNIAKRLANKGHEVICWNRTPKINEVKEFGGIFVNEISEIVNLLKPRRIYLIMLPAGNVIDEIINKICETISPNDIIIDGGNSYYKDSIRRYKMLKEKGISFLDCGTSGGIWGYQNGYCLMIGGNKEDFQYCEPIFKDLAPTNGYLHTGEAGSGHFVKMIHNGIEYGMLSAYGEGFELLKNSNFNLKLNEIAKLWNNGSVIRSWLLELLENALNNNPSLSDIKDYVEDSGEGRWTVLESIEKSIPTPIITLSLFNRFFSRQDESFALKVIAALRKEFGGHNVLKNSNTLNEK